MFRSYLPHLNSKSAPFLLLDSLLIEEFFEKIENFFSTGSIDWEPAQSVRRISIKVHYWSKFDFRALELVLVISTSSELEIALRFSFLDSLFFKEHFVKISIFFSAGSTDWHPVQRVL